MKTTQVISNRSNTMVNKITYSAPFNLTKESVDDRLGYFINGIAINETVTRNGVKYEAEELEKAAHTLQNKPLLKDHENKTDNIIGRVRESTYDKLKRAIVFRAQVMDEKAIEMMQDGRITNVSIGAMFKSFEESESNGEKHIVVRGLEFLELSTTPVPGDPGASLTNALAEAYSLKETQSADFVSKGEKMTNTDKKPEDEDNSSEEKYKTQLAELKAKLAEQNSALNEANSALEKVAEEKRQQKLKEYKSLCEKLKVTPKEFKNEAFLDDAISLLKEMAEQEEDEDEEVKETKTKSKIVSEIKDESLILEDFGHSQAIWRMPGLNGELSGGNE
jgi:hypothetical protein